MEATFLTASASLTEAPPNLNTFIINPPVDIKGLIIQYRNMKNRK
jgi:hypothetical protein